MVKGQVVRKKRPIQRESGGSGGSGATTTAAAARRVPSPSTVQQGRNKKARKEVKKQQQQKDDLEIDDENAVFEDDEEQEEEEEEERTALLEKRVGKRTQEQHADEVPVSDDNDDDDDGSEIEDEHQEQENLLLAASVKQQRGNIADIHRAFIQQYASSSSPKAAAPQEKDAAVVSVPTVLKFSIGHNRNAVTSVCCDPMNARAIFYTDKSGRVYRCQFGGTASKTNKSKDQQQQQKNKDNSSGLMKEQLDPVHSGTANCVAVSNTLHATAASAAAAGLLSNDGTAAAAAGTSAFSSKRTMERSTVDHTVSYVASGGSDCTIRIWRRRDLEYLGELKQHHAGITQLVFRQHANTLYSASLDGCVRMWSVAEMSCTDKFFGHIGAIYDVATLSLERCLTGGSDRVLRYWKCDAATRTDFVGMDTAIECVTMLNEGLFCCGCSSGTLSFFDVNRRGPWWQVKFAHGYNTAPDGTGLERDALAMLQQQNQQQHQHQQQQGGGKEANDQEEEQARNPLLGNSVTAVAAVSGGNEVASGSYDGFVRLWKVTYGVAGAKGSGSVVPSAQFMIVGFVNSLRFSDNGDALYAGVAKEPKFGRWKTVSLALNSVVVVAFSEQTRRRCADCTGASAKRGSPPQQQPQHQPQQKSITATPAAAAAAARPSPKPFADVKDDLGLVQSFTSPAAGGSSKKKNQKSTNKGKQNQPQQQQAQNVKKNKKKGKSQKKSS